HQQLEFQQVLNLHQFIPTNILKHLHPFLLNNNLPTHVHLYVHVEHILLIHIEHLLLIHKPALRLHRSSLRQYFSSANNQILVHIFANN
ncbi:MAG: hypothetical protein L6R42_010375, partial [Xanthoria sp. 1 TBL-2021]